jgi:hypothetical protein
MSIGCRIGYALGVTEKGPEWKRGSLKGFGAIMSTKTMAVRGCGVEDADGTGGF